MTDHAMVVRGLSRSFGGVKAVEKVDLDIAKKSILGLIGPNGAGKTTMFNLISGLIPPMAGTVTFYGKDVTGSPPHRINRLGVSRTFQNVRVFDSMSVLENVMVGCHSRTRSGFISAMFKLPSERKEERLTRDKCMKALSLVGLETRAGEEAGSLPFGLLRYLEIARALVSDPKLVLLDEPAAGLNRTETEKLGELIARLRDEMELSVVLVEHDMRLVMEISDRVAVLDRGVKIADGTPREVQNDPAVVAAYLGEESDKPETAGGREC